MTRPRLLAAPSMLAAVVVLALTLAACGGDKKTDTNANLATAAPAATITSGGIPAPPATTAGAGAASATASAPTAAVSFPLTTQSNDGRLVTFAKAAERIICLSPGNTEIFYAIGAGKSVIATDQFSDYPAEAKALPKIDYSNPSVESIVALKPDLVIAATRQKELVPAFEQVGLKVLLLEEPAAIDGVLARVTLQGAITNRPQEAAALVAEMQGKLKSVTDRVASVSGGPRVYHELDPGLFSVAPNSFIGDMYTRLKARNIAQGAAGAFPQLSAEAIIAADPEVIVLTDAKYPGGSPDEVKKRSGWSAISAIKSNRLYAIEGDLVSRPGPRIVEGFQQIAKALYPDLFR